MQAVVIGGTGAIGKALVQELDKSPKWKHVVLLLRRPYPEAVSDKVKQVIVTDFEKLEEEHADEFRGVDATFNCLGTTIKQAGSQETMYKIDHDIPLAAARLSKEHSVHHYLHVSALNSNPDSRFFYVRLKGETERDLIGVGFPRISIFRPALLLAERENKRMGESIASTVFTGLDWFFKRVAPSMRAIKVEDVAKAMRVMAEKDADAGATGTAIYPNEEIQKIADTHA